MLDVYFSGLLMQLVEMLGDVVTPLGNLLSDGLQMQAGNADWAIDMGFIDKHILGLNAKLSDFAIKHAGSMTAAARALGAILALCLAAGQAYKMMTKGEGLDVLELGKPILIALILTHWTAVVEVVSFPGKLVEAQTKAMFEASASQCANLRNQRKEKAQEVTRMKEAKVAASEVMNKNVEWWDVVGQVQNGIQHVKNFLETRITSWMTSVFDFFENIIVWVGEVVFQVAIYVVFLTKAIFFFALAFFGPIQFAASILPVWKDAWQQWVGKMVSVSLYGACAYICMAFSMVLIQYALEADLGKLTVITTTGEGLWAYAKSGFGTALTSVIAYFVGAFAMKSVPEMSTWAIPGHASMAASSFIGGLGGKANKYNPSPIK